MLLWMMLKRCMVACALFLVGTSGVEGSLLSDLLSGPASTFAEQQSVTRGPDCTLSADAAYARILELLSDGRQGQAEDLVKSAVKTYRNDVRILFAKGVLERSRWDKDAAQVWFAMARKANGKKHLSQAAWLSVRLDRRESVKENMAELIRLSDENPDDIFLLWLSAIQCREQSRATASSQSEKWAFAEAGKRRYEMLLEHFRLGPVMVHHTYANILSEALRVRDQETALEHRLIAVSLEAKGWTLQGLGNTLMKMGEYEWANAVWARTVHVDPFDATYWYGWGNALVDLNRIPEAEEKYRESIKLRPTYGKGWDMLAYCLRRQGASSEEICGTFQKAIELGANSARFNLAHTYDYGLGVPKDKGKAVQYYEETLLHDPDHKDALKRLMVIYSERHSTFRDSPHALEVVKRAVALDADYSNLCLLASVYQHKKQYAKAVEVYEKALQVHQEKNHGEPISKRQQDRLEGYKRQRDGALKKEAKKQRELKEKEELEEALQKNPDDPEKLSQMARFLLNPHRNEWNDYPRAIDLAQRSIAIEETTEGFAVLSEAYSKTKQRAEAEKAKLRQIELFREMNPTKPVPQQWIWQREGIGRAMAREKGPQYVLEYQEELLAMNPDAPDKLYQLAWVLMRSKNPALHDYPRAIGLIKQACVIDETEEFLGLLAEAYHLNGQPAKAIETAERAILLYKKNYPTQVVPRYMEEKLKKYKTALDGQEEDD